jgi:hypothetical protein
MSEFLNSVLPVGEAISNGLETLGVVFILLCCCIVGLSVEAGRRNDAIRENCNREKDTKPGLDRESQP